MPAPRQQRTNNARGRLPFQQLYSATNIAWDVTSAAGTTVVLQLFNVTGELQLNGVPAFKEDTTNNLPTNAVLAGDVLTLTYANNVSPARPITLPNKDPALRTSLGGFMVAGVINVVAPSGTTVELTAPNGNIAAQVSVIDFVLVGQVVNAPGPQPDGSTFWCVVPTAVLGNVVMQGVSPAPKATMAPGTMTSWTYTAGAWV